MKNDWPLRFLRVAVDERNVEMTIEQDRDATLFDRRRHRYRRFGCGRRGDEPVSRDQPSECLIIITDVVVKFVAVIPIGERSVYKDL